MGRIADEGKTLSGLGKHILQGVADDGDHGALAVEFDGSQLRKGSESPILGRDGSMTGVGNSKRACLNIVKVGMKIVLNSLPGLVVASGRLAYGELVAAGMCQLRCQSAVTARQSMLGSQMRPTTAADRVDVVDLYRYKT